MMIASCRTILPGSDAVLSAWKLVQPDGCDLDGVELLKEGKATAAYRLLRAGADGSHVIAKRCRRAAAAVERKVYERVLPRLSLPTLQYYGCAGAAAGG